jgi:beta-lactamase regulating signal transducer with metallopeptidase domain
MTAQLAAHLATSTLFLALLLTVLALAHRRLTAAARCWLAFIGMAKFAIPASILAPLLTAAPTPLRLPLPRLLGGGAMLNAAPPAHSVWPAVAFGVWAVVALALIVRFELTRRRLVALAVRTAGPAEGREVAALARARAFLGIRRRIDIARSSLPEAPAVLRVLRPLIILPAGGCDDLSDGELESLLRHECAHVARHDNLIARIEAFLCALFWFHPLLWIAQRITAVERERACDERVAGSADERDTYLAALTKFCHAAIAPRLPGVSCMATANLKERIDHVMNYETLRRHAPPPRRVAVIAAAALVLFTVASAMAGRPANSEQQQIYTVSIDAQQNGDIVILSGTVRDDATGATVTIPVTKFTRGNRAEVSAVHEGLGATFDIRPDGDDLGVDVTVRRNGALAYASHVKVRPGDGAAGKYTGEPISLSLKDADLRDVLKTFGKLTGLDVRLDDSVQGKVTVFWQGVPWDKALDTLLIQNGCSYRIEGHTLIITKN